MGGSQSATPSLSEVLMEDYLQLTYLTQNEIFRIYKKLLTLNDEIDRNILHRFRWADIQHVFPELKFNPFADRLEMVFSSQNDGRLSFEDLLDLFSALSPDCPSECKAKWALKIFDFNDSNALEVGDIVCIIDRLTSGGRPSAEDSKCLDHEHKEKIAQIILSEIDLDHTGSIVPMEFVHAASKIPDFCSSFTLKL